MKPLLVAVLLAWGVWVTASISLPFPGPVPQEEQQQSRQPKDKHPAADHVPLIFRIGKFIDDHNGIFSAFATLAIAYFTFSLKSSTDKLWCAGRAVQR
jgi:hypothetical protein